MKLFFCLFLFFLVGLRPSFAQTDSLAIKDFIKQKSNIDSLRINYPYSYSNRPSILVGYNLGHGSYGEIGFALNSNFHSMFFGTKFIGSEFRMGGFDFIIGPKVGLYFGMGIGIGLNAIYYTNFK